MSKDIYFQGNSRFSSHSVTFIWKERMPGKVEMWFRTIWTTRKNQGKAEPAHFCVHFEKKSLGHGMPTASPGPWLAAGGFFLVCHHSAGACRFYNCTLPTKDGPWVPETSLCWLLFAPCTQPALCQQWTHCTVWISNCPTNIPGWCSVEHICGGWVGGPGPLLALAGAASLCSRPQLPATPLPWLLLFLSSTNSSASPGPSGPVVATSSHLSWYPCTSPSFAGFSHLWNCPLVHLCSVKTLWTCHVCPDIKRARILTSRSHSLNQLAKAGDTGSIPGLGRFHMPGSN